MVVAVHGVDLIQRYNVVLILFSNNVHIQTDHHVMNCYNQLIIIIKHRADA